MKNTKRNNRVLRLLALPLAVLLLAAALCIVVSLRAAGPAAAPGTPEPEETPLPLPVSIPEPAPEPTPTAPAGPMADLRLSELMAKNRSAWRAPDGSFPDWIELYNADSEPVELSGWRLSDKKDGGWTLPSVTLQPGAYLLVCADGSGRAEEGQLCADFSLSPGETVSLFDPAGTLVDRLDCSAETANHAVAVDDGGVPFETRDATPGLPNTPDGAAAYAASLTPRGPLSINEVAVSNLGQLEQNGRYYDWVELKNTSDESVRLSDYCLSDDPDDPLLWRLPERTLAPGKTFLIFCSGDDGLGAVHANFKLNDAEEDLFLSAADGRVVDHVYLRGIPAGGSMGRHAGHPGWYRFLSPTPGKENGDIVVFIEKNCLTAGEPVRAYNPLGCELRWTLGGTERPGDTLVPEEADYGTWISVSAWQDGRLVSQDRAYFSRLPVLYIDTKDGAPIRSRTAWRSGALTIQNNVPSDAYEYAGAVSIRGRGNMSWNWEKKPYRIKLGSKADLFGMGGNKNWVLLANYLDESFLRNPTAGQISAELGLVTMESVWTDVVLNGEYAGNYQLCEQIRIDESRVGIFDWEAEAKRVAAAICEQEKRNGRRLDEDELSRTLKRDLSWITSGTAQFGGRSYTLSDYCRVQADHTGGFLFELSKEFDEQSEFQTASLLKVMVKSPEALRTNREMMNYVKALWEAFDAAYRTEDGYASTAEGPIHYTQLADLDSMVAFWLTNELVGNQDAYKKSRFAYKDLGQPIHYGPVWDFDWGCGSLKTPFSHGGGWILAVIPDGESFFKEWLDDPLFVVRATEQYWRVRPFLEDLIREGGILEEETSYLRVSGLADQARWNRRNTWPDLARGFELDAATYLRFLRERIAWMDEQFASDGALLDGVRTTASASPYFRASDALVISVAGAEADDASPHAPAEHVLPRGADAEVSVAVSARGAARLEVYCNGLHVGSVPVEAGAASFALSSEQLSAPDGAKNVISLIAKSAAGETVGRNYTTLLLRD